MLTMILAWVLVCSSVFVSIFYLSIFQKSQDSEEVDYPEKWPSISVLVPAYNEEEVVGDSISNLLNLDYPNYQVVFVNDASTDGTLKEAERFGDSDKLQIINLEENYGKAGALNNGLSRIESELAVVQDADSVIEKGLLKDAAAKMQNDSSLGAVIARILPLNSNSFFRKLQINEYTVTNFYRSLMCKVDTLDVTPGAFAIYRTADLKEIDGFDEGNLTEDLDVAMRLRKKGRSLGMVYDKVSRTELPKNFSRLKGQRVRWARGFIQNSFKHIDMYFNSNYGWFGKFQLPMHAFMPFVAILGLFLIVYGLLEGLYNFYLHVSAVGFTFVAPELSLIEALIGFQWKIYIPLISSLIITGYLIKKAYITSGKPVQHGFSLLFYFLGFFVVKAYFWSNAIFKEFIREANTWS